MYKCACILQFLKIFRWNLKRNFILQEERYIFNVRMVETLHNNDERYQTISDDNVPATVQNEQGFCKDTVHDIFFYDYEQLHFAYNKTVIGFKRICTMEKRCYKFSMMSKTCGENNLYCAKPFHFIKQKLDKNFLQ